MIYNKISLNNLYSNYSNINQKISLEIKKNRLVRIKNGLYSDDIVYDSSIASNICYGESYISFEYALSFYGLIPEYVSTYTCACFNKKNNKLFKNSYSTFEYRSVPNDVYYYGIKYMENEKGIRYKMASKEKALCDTLYQMYPVRSIRDLEELLFDNLRIDTIEFERLDFSFIKEIAPLYHSNTLLTLLNYIKEHNL